MSDEVSYKDDDQRARLRERVARIEERSEARDKTLERIEAALLAMADRVNDVAISVGGARVGIRVGAAIMAALTAVGGTLATHFWPGK